MKKAKMMQIPQKLFVEVYTLVTQIRNQEKIDPDLLRAIERGLDNKLDAMRRHQMYTVSKMADDEYVREAARQDYLEEVGMHEDWRW